MQSDNLRLGNGVSHATAAAQDNGRAADAVDSKSVSFHDENSSLTIDLHPRRRTRVDKTQSLQSSFMRSDGRASIKLTVDKLHRTDSKSSLRLDASDYEIDSRAHRLTSNRNELDDSDNSSQTNNSAAANYIHRMRSRLKTPFSFSRKHIPQTTLEDEAPPLPESEVETVVQRLEERNANRVSVPPEVKAQFLKMCLNVCRLRVTDSNIDCGCGEVKVTSDSPCILRNDVINMRNRVRLEVELRSRSTRFRDTIKTFFGFHCHSETLLNVLNRAVDLIDSSGHEKARQRRLSRSTALEGSSSISENGIVACPLKKSQDPDDEEWFYYKDFAFYSLKEESYYPWMRKPVLFSILVTLSFYIMSPILWCAILKDENICPASEDGSHNGWSSALYFASVTMSTVGYGDITVLGGEDFVENWRIFVGIIFMILSLVVSVVGLHAGLDTQFNPFRRRIDDFLRRVSEIINEKKDLDKHDHITMQMKFYKFAELFEIILTFFMLNLLGVFVLRIFLAFDTEIRDMSWMESFYWAVQTTTTIGYGDVETPHAFKWFLLFYLAISTYFVGNAIGKLRDVGKRLDTMQKLYLWEQQEASYEMLQYFSGRQEYTTTEDGRVLAVEPEIDQYEFTIASLVLIGKITSDDVRPIVAKFKQLTNTSKISKADVAGPTKKVMERGEDGNSPRRFSGKNKEESFRRNSSSSSAVSVTKKIAIAFKEEVIGGVNSSTDDKKKLPEAAEDMEADYKSFSLPKNTYAIGIDDSNIQRKLIQRYFTMAGIPEDHCTIIGDGRDEIMGFEDFCIQFMESHQSDFVFLIVDENLDVTTKDAKLETISGSECVENIRKRLSVHLEKRMFALVRSANDSSSDVALYEKRAHGFLPKAPIKKGGVLEALAPKWLHRFPPSEFEYTADESTRPKVDGHSDVAASPLDIESKMGEIDRLFSNVESDASIHQIKDLLHELKGDLLTLNSSVSVTPLIGLINLILVAQTYDMIGEKWLALRNLVKEVLSSLEKSFKLPSNTRGLAIDDSQIQRKLLSKFYEFSGIPSDRLVVLGGSCEEILGFIDFAVTYVESHPDDHIFMIVDENLDVEESKDGTKRDSVSGSHCVEKIRKRLSKKDERRVLALVRSANDSTSDLSLYNIRCHGFLPKAPIRKERINETLAPLWYKRFPPSEFGLCLRPDLAEEAPPSGDVHVACSSGEIIQKLNEINMMFIEGVHLADQRRINDVLHELKGDLLTMAGFNASMISIIGQINMMLQSSHNPADTMSRWETLYDKAHSKLEASQELAKPVKSTVVQKIRKRSSLLVSSSLTKDF